MFIIVCFFLAVDALLLSVLSNRESLVGSFLCAMLGFAFVAYLSGTSVIPFVIAHVWDIPLWFGIYVLAGIPWAFAKWWLFSLRARKSLKEWMVLNPPPVLDTSASMTDLEVRKKRDDFSAAMAHYSRMGIPGPVVYNSLTGKFSVPASNHKSRITAWLMFWPFSILGTIFDDFLFRLWENIYEVCSTSFQRISDSVFADINE